MHATNASMPSSKENVSHVCQAMQNASLTPGQLAHGHSSGEWSLDFLNPHAPRDWSLWPQSYEATGSILPSFCGIPLSSSYIPQNSASAPLQYQPTTQATVMAPEGQYLYTQGMPQNNYQAGESYYPSLGGTNNLLFSSYTLQDDINVPYQGQTTAQASVDVKHDGYPLFTFGTQGVSPWIQTPYAQNMSTPGPHAQSSSTEQTFSDWKEYKYDGKRYYYNWKTKQSSWQKPFDLMTTIERADSLTDWMEFTSQEGHKYYYNKVTKQRRWTIPEELKLARARAFTSVTCPSFTETAHLASLGTVPSVQMSASAAASSSVSVMTSAVSSNPFTAASVDSAITATAAASKFSSGFDVPISGMPSHSYLETAKSGSSQERNIPLTQLSATVSASMGNPSFSMDAQMASNENVNGSASLSNLTVTQKDSAQDMEESLVSALRSFNLKSQEVKLHEENTEREIEAAQEADRYTFKKVENLVRTVNSLKEKNEMLATGVHNEKAALTAEARDVQLRLLALSTERDECLLTIQKMHQILEERLAAANEKLATFKHNKLEREEILSKMLVEQEILLADTVQESLRFEQEVENNSKLREFVMDQHCLADQLQGELDAIREDMELLKSKVN